MNIFELAFWAGIVWLLFMGSTWLSEQVDINRWIIFPVAVVVVLCALEVGGRVRRKKSAETKLPGSSNDH